MKRIRRTCASFPHKTPLRHHSKSVDLWLVEVSVGYAPREQGTERRTELSRISLQDFRKMEGPEVWVIYMVEGIAEKQDALATFYFLAI